MYTVSYMRPERVQRSILAVPATSNAFLLKAASCSADGIFIDLEDAVPLSQKSQARAAAVDALQQLSWGAKTVSVRVNALGSEWALDDLISVSQCGRLDTVLIPKVETADDVLFVHRLLLALELKHLRNRPFGLEILIETTKGLANVEAIAASSPRLESIAFGVGDYCLDLQTFDTAFGSSNKDYAVLARASGAAPTMHWNDQWHFAMARISNAARANGLRPIDGPYTDYHDSDGYGVACRRSRALGFEGKWAIHPSQIDTANLEFSPPPELISWAKNISERMKAAESDGRGAIGVDGVLIDLAHVKLADRIMRRAAMVADMNRSTQR